MSDAAFRAPKDTDCTCGPSSLVRSRDCPIHGDMSLPASIPPQDAACSRCGGEKDWEDCWNCEDGFSGHDCGEDCCCCIDPEENVVCDICRGEGGFFVCRCATEAPPLSEGGQVSEVSAAAQDAVVGVQQPAKGEQ